MHVRLDRKIPDGGSFKLVKTDDNQIPYTIDFVELEAVPEAVSLNPYKMQIKSCIFLLKGGLISLQQRMVEDNLYSGREIDVEERISISRPNTKVIGAGMWYTEIYFSASSDNKQTYNKRGIEADADNIVLEGLYLNTVNNKRYYNDNSNYQVGKGLMGSFGANSVIKNVWVEHFECGGWIDGTDRLRVSHAVFGIIMPMG